MILHSSQETVDAVVARLVRTTGPIAVMAGHFALVQHRETGTLVAGIVDDIAHEATRRFVAEHPYMGNFPLETWRAGVDVVARLRAAGRDAKLLILVNDWQHVPPAQDGQPSRERDAFFADAVIPPVLRAVMNSAGLSDDAIVPDARHGKPCLFWCESRYLSRYNRHLKYRVPVESACAREWVPVLARLEELGYGGFAAFVPGTCHVAIVGGTERAIEYLDLALQLIIISPMGDAQNIWSEVLVQP